MNELEYLPGEPGYHAFRTFTQPWGEITKTEVRSELICQIKKSVVGRIQFLAEPWPPFSGDEEDYRSPNFREVIDDVELMFDDPRKFIAKEYQYSEVKNVPSRKKVDLTIRLARGIVYMSKEVGGGSNLTEEEATQIVKEALTEAGYTQESFLLATNGYREQAYPHGKYTRKLNQ